MLEFLGAALSEPAAMLICQHVTGSHSPPPWNLTVHCGVTLGSAHRFSSTSAGKTLAIKPKYKLLAREKKALVLYDSLALISFIHAKTQIRILTYSTNTAARYGQFILVKSVFQFLFYVQQQRRSKATAESHKNCSTSASSEPPRGFTALTIRAEGTALRSCHVTHHGERRLVRTLWGISPLRTCTLLLRARNLSSGSDLPSS